MLQQITEGTVMYYNSNKYANDYYNSYKQEMQEVELYRKKQGNLHQIVNIALIVVTSLLLVSSLFYLYKYFYPTSMVQKSSIMNSETIHKEELIPMVTTEDELPQSPQLQELAKRSERTLSQNATDTFMVSDSERVVPKSSVNSEEISHVVKMVMSKMTTEKESAMKKEKKLDTTKLNDDFHNKVILSSEQSPNASLENHQTMLTHIVIPNSITQKTVKEEVAPTKRTRIIIVQKGDTLFKIAKRAYGTSKAYPKILSANPELIKNPNQIFEGQKLRIPS